MQNLCTCNSVEAREECGEGTKIYQEKHNLLGTFGTQTYFKLWFGTNSGKIMQVQRLQTTDKCQCHDGTIADPPEYDKLNIPCQTVSRSTAYIAFSRMCRKSVAYSCERVSSHKSLMRQVVGRRLMISAWT